MKTRRKWFSEPASNAVVEITVQFDELGKPFPTKTTEGKLGPINQANSIGISNILKTREFWQLSARTIERFILLLIFLFSALEEAEWLFCSAHMNQEEKIKDDSGWSIYNLIDWKWIFPES